MGIKGLRPPYQWDGTGIYPEENHGDTFKGYSAPWKGASVGQAHGDDVPSLKNRTIQYINAREE